MRKILVLGAGRSAASLIEYLIENAGEQQWRITVADRDPAHARALVKDGPGAATPAVLDAADPEARATAVAAHDLVVSMLPAAMHMAVLHDCLRYRKHIITPSYVPDDLWTMDEEVRAAGIIALNEMGLDPGIDHMSAMRIMDRIRSEGGHMDAFESHTGGLVAPESDDNPWGYKFSWNPRNVVLAGQGGAAKYIADGITRYIPYHRLFQRTIPMTIPGTGAFEGYPNRDSTKYRKAYGIPDIPTLIRGTLRKSGFCRAWDALVQLGCTDDGAAIELPSNATWEDYTNAFLPHASLGNTRQNTAHYLGLANDDEVLDKLEWLGLFSGTRIGRTGLSAAAMLQDLLESKWALAPGDKDMVVMWHRFRYTVEGRGTELLAWLTAIGKDRTHTAMARTVGLPIAMACKPVLNGDIKGRGVLLPLTPDIYAPVLDELEQHGIVFQEERTTG